MLSLLLLLAAAPQRSEPALLPTLAASSPRPRVCRPSSASAASELWSRARGEAARSYCLLLARGYARLERAPAEALELSRRALGTLPAEVEPRVLEGRALLRLGEWQAARNALVPSVTAEGRPLGDVQGLRELAVSLTWTGQVPEAAAVYRVLVPRVEFTRDTTYARVVQLEAAAATMALGATGLAEAEQYLAVARQKAAVPGLADLTLALFALALDRRGERAQAEVVLSEMPGPWGLERFASARDTARASAEVLPGEAAAALPEPTFDAAAPMLADGELHAAIGVAAFRSDPRLASLHLRAFLNGPGAKGPWAEWAAQRVAALGKRRELGG